MSFPFVTQAQFIYNSQDIRKLCIDRFGKKHEAKYSKKTGQKMDNHGNWEFTPDAKVSFRYERDFILFMLLASHLADPPRYVSVGATLRAK